MDGAVVLKMQDICKSFPGVKVLDQVNLELRKSEGQAV